MNIKHIAIPALALAAGTYLIPSDSQGFVTLGNSLNLSRRDVRVFNNFTDASANNNAVEDPNFPGYDGAEAAMWRAIVEWGSELHGTGQGDPHQPTGLGSGGANFDASWQGNANGTGGFDNIIAELSGSDGSTFAFAQWDSFSNWRIRFYSTWSWSDGPGNVVGTQRDLQGIAVHEYGHALGLGHTGIAGSTMTGGTVNGFTDRSIAGDDISGVRAIYGIKAATKSKITGINKCDDQLTITGEQFSATQNEVWFTQAGSGGNGTPVKVTNVVSNGTELTVTIPGNAGDGDVQVKKQGSSASSLSNAWPINMAVDGTCSTPVFTYCTGDGGSGFGCTDCPCGNNSAPGSGLGCLNGAGTGCVLLADGLASFSNGTLSFDVTGANPLTFGVLSSGQAALPTNPANPCFGLDSGVQSMLLDGLRCIGVGLIRHGSRATNASGSNTFPWANSIIANTGSVAGQFRYFQVFYREQLTLQCGTGQNTSTGIALQIVP